MLRTILVKFYRYYLDRKKIRNLFRKKNAKKALLIYLVEPFIRGKVSHGNFFEAKGIAYALDSLDYNVDVVNHSCKIKMDSSEYDLTIGFGEAFNEVFNSPVRSPKTILYATSQHSFVLNKSAMSAAKRFYDRSGLLDLSLVRYRQKSWQATYDLVDGIIVVDGAVATTMTYKNNSLVDRNSINSVSPPYIEIYDGPLKQNNFTQKQFLWFAGDGPVHKGLDLLLDYFYEHKDVNLHVVGNISKYKIFFDFYAEQLKFSTNIFYYGFLDVNSTKLVEIALNCDFVILPSCSEGMPNSLTTIVGNFGCIPVLTDACSFSAPNFVTIPDLSNAGIDEAIASCRALKVSLKMKNKNRDFVAWRYTTASYVKETTDYIKKISEF